MPPDAMQRPSIPPARARWRALALLACALVLAMSPWFSATAVLAQLRTLYGFDATFSAWLTIAVQLGFVLGATASSVSGLADRIPARVLITVAGLLAAACNAALLAADAPWQWLALRLATGACLAGVYPPALKLIATWFDRGRGLALGVLVGAITIGSALPHLANALVGADWTRVIVLTSATTAAGALLVGIAVAEGPFPFPRAAFRWRDARTAIGNRGVLRATGGYLGHMWELYAMWAWFAVYAGRFVDAHGSRLHPSTLAFAVIATGALGCVVAGFAADRFGKARVAAAAMLVSAACCLLVPLAFAGPAWLFVALCLVWGASVIADSAQFSAIVAEQSAPRLVGTALTLQLGAGFLLTAVTLWLLPFAADIAGSWRWVPLLLVAGPLLGIAALWPLVRAERRRTPG